MRYLYGLCGATLLTTLIGCAGTERPAKVATDESPKPTAAASDETPAAELASLREFQLIDGTFACMLAWREPAVASPSTTGGEPTQGAAALEEAEATQAAATRMDVAGSAQCASTAQAMGFSPAVIGAGDPAATARVRRVVRTLLSVNDVAPDVSDKMSALFDRGIAAIETERTVRQALQEKRALDAAQSDPLRDLAHFARDMKSSTIGTEAQALVWILGAQRFAEVPHASPPRKIVAGQALVSAVLDTPGYGRKSTTESWNQYIASAVRSLRSDAARRGPAIGGGPPSDGEEDDNTRAIVNAAKARMRTLTARLPETSAMRSELTRAAAQLDAFTEGE